VSINFASETLPLDRFVEPARMTILQRNARWAAAANGAPIGPTSQPAVGTSPANAAPTAPATTSPTPISPAATTPTVTPAPAVGGG
jgi:hypothetical protein